MKVIEKNDDILELFASLNNHEVFTPPDIARDMLDLLPEEVWTQPQYKFLDPATKTGVFLREITFRLFEGLRGKGIITGYDGKKYNLNDNKERMNHILKNMVFGIATSELTGYMSRRTLYGVMDASSDKGEAILNHLIQIDEDIKTKEDAEKAFDYSTINDYYDPSLFYSDENYKDFEKEGNIFYPYQEVDLIKKEFEDEGKDIFGVEDTFFPFIQDDIKHKKIKEIKECKMKFDVIIGNPPYQMSDGAGGGGSSAKPIYNKFIEMAIELEPEYLTMIVPSRWMSGGKGLDKFRKKMLNDERIEKIYDFKNSKICFPSVSIEGGINYFLWNKHHKGLCQYSEINEEGLISSKIRKLNEFDIFIRDNFSTEILNKILLKQEETLNQRVSVSKPFGLRSNFSDFKIESFKNSLKLYGNKVFMKQSKGIGFIKKESILNNYKIIDKYKIIVSKARGLGKDNIILSMPLLIEPNSVCSETYLVIDSFDNKEEAENLIKYIKTKFFRFLVSLRKNTQNTTKDTYSFVPVLDMTEEWTDEKLYKRYNLTKEEIKYIEENISEMK